MSYSGRSAEIDVLGFAKSLAAEMRGHVEQGSTDHLTCSEFSIGDLRRCKTPARLVHRWPDKIGERIGPMQADWQRRHG